MRTTFGSQIFDMVFNPDHLQVYNLLFQEPSTARHTLLKCGAVSSVHIYIEDPHICSDKSDG